MADAIDEAQALSAAHNDAAVQAHAQRPQKPGRETCANLDCGDDITKERQALGAQLCLTCQKAEEGRAAHFARWRQR